MKRYDQITGAVLFAASVFYIVEAAKMPFMAGKTPGSGWLPLILGALMALLAVLLFISGTVRAASADSTVSWPTGNGLVNNAAILIGLVIAVLILEAAGFLAASLVFLFALFTILGRYRLIYSLAASVIASLILYCVFRVWLDIPLPAGFINFP